MPFARGELAHDHVRDAGNWNGCARTPDPRRGLVTIAGQVFSVTQAGASTCSYSINPAGTNTAATGGTASISVTAATGCAWNAASTAAWIMVSSGANGNGNGTVGLTIAANTALTSRTGTVNLGGQVFTVTQAAATCTYTVTPTTLSVPAFGLTSALTVGTGASCSWAPSGVPSWITMSTATRTGSGQLAYTITANTGAGAHGDGDDQRRHGHGDAVVGSAAPAVRVPRDRRLFAAIVVTIARPRWSPRRSG